MGWHEGAAAGPCRRGAAASQLRPGPLSGAFHVAAGCQAGRGRPGRLPGPPTSRGLISPLLGSPVVPDLLVWPVLLCFGPVLSFVPAALYLGNFPAGDLPID